MRNKTAKRLRRQAEQETKGKTVEFTRKYYRLLKKDFRTWRRSGK